MSKEEYIDSRVYADGVHYVAESRVVVYRIGGERLSLELVRGVFVPNGGRQQATIGSVYVEQSPLMDL